MTKRQDTCNFFESGQAYYYGSQRQPRRLPPSETQLWRWYQAEHPEEWYLAYYDVLIPRHSGGFVEPLHGPQTIEEACERGARFNNALRADVIATRGTIAQIFEIHLQPREECAGRVRRYRELCQHWWPQYQWLRPIILSEDRIAGDILGAGYPDLRWVSPDTVTAG